MDRNIVLSPVIAFFGAGISIFVSLYFFIQICDKIVLSSILPKPQAGDGKSVILYKEMKTAIRIRRVYECGHREEIPTLFPIFALR